MVLSQLRKKLVKLILGRRFYYNCTFATEESRKAAVHHHEEYIDRLVKCSNNMSFYKPRIHVIHVIVTDNVGDINCGPEYYLKKAGINTEIIIHDLDSINQAMIRKEDIVIIGGGGLIDYSDEWNGIINQCISLSDNVVMWGAGFNRHYCDYRSTNIIVSQISTAKIQKEYDGLENSIKKILVGMPGRFWSWRFFIIDKTSKL